jgi:hypothetical protein
MCWLHPLTGLRSDVQRYNFITLLSGATATWPPVARQEPAIGFLSVG